MDEGRFSISPNVLYDSLGAAAAPVLIDVRRAAAFEADDRMVVGAVRRAPETIDDWAAAMPASRPAVVYCVHGHEVSRNAAARLRAGGVEAGYLDGGIEAWAAAGLPVRRRTAAATGKWVTRARPRIDRIACPWLIRRFIDPEAVFFYAPTAEVAATAAREAAAPYDMPGVAAFGHDGELCSFDAFLRFFGIADPALDALALIVRGADTDRLELAPQSPGLLAMSAGLSALHADDHAMLEQGMTLYDALYAWCRLQRVRAAAG